MGHRDRWYEEVRSEWVAPAKKEYVAMTEDLKSGQTGEEEGD